MSDATNTGQRPVPQNSRTLGSLSCISTVLNRVYPLHINLRTFIERNQMHELAMIYPAAALGYSLIYMLFGGGLFGAVVIFFVAKMFGK